MQVSVVIPAYDERQRISETLRELVAYFSSTSHSFELIVVDDGSRDATATIVTALDQPCIKLVRNVSNQGKGSALRKGIAAAGGQLLFLVDADLPYSTRAFDTSLPLLLGGAHAVIGARDLPDSQLDPSYPRHRIWMGRVFSYIVNRLLPLDIFDTQCGFKGFRADVLKKAALFASRRDYTLDIELLLILRRWGSQIQKIPVQLVHHHGSKIRTVRDSLAMFRAVLRIRRNLSAGAYPGEPPTQPMRSVACPLCRSSDTRPIAGNGVHRFCRCGSCRTILQTPRLSDGILDQQYDQSYFQSEDLMAGYPDYSHRPDLQQKTAAWQWQQIEDSGGRRPWQRLLDIGCGSSHLLELGLRKGRECWGVDLVDLQLDPSIQFRKGSFLEVDLPEQFFDLVVFNDSFEHFPDPAKVLNRCRKLLRPGGRLVINMPDPDSWVARFSGTSWISFKREHLLLYARGASHRLFAASSFFVLRRFSSWQAVDWPYLEPRLARVSAAASFLSGLLFKLVPVRSFWVPTSGSTWVLESRGP